MAGRKLASVIGLAVGLFSFFMPLVIVSVAPGTQLKWSGYSVMSQIVGFSSEHFWDIAAALVYGGDSEPDSNIEARSAASDGSNAGAVAGLTLLISTALAYCILITLVVVVAAKYLPGRVSRIRGAGLIATIVALVSFFVLADTSVNHYEGAAERGIVGLDAGIGLYLLLASFTLLFSVQRLVALDRVFVSPERKEQDLIVHRSPPAYLVRNPIRIRFSLL